jgi:DNA-binding beta-propeller fold protein YncE
MDSGRVLRTLRRAAVAASLLSLFVLTTMAPAQAAPAFTAFESGQVRPLALSPDGKHLFAVNTPDNRLEIFRVQQDGLTLEGSVAVGLEPVAVAARSDAEVWVVNHLSDSVSVVDVTHPSGARVVRTLLVGDEPRDIVFGGPGRARAFITAAHRGQHLPFDPQLTTPGVGRADVWVFNANNLGLSLGGSPLNILTLFTDTPRALAVSPSGATVYAAGFHTGNKTTSIHRLLVEAGGGPPAPVTNAAGESQPAIAIIVKWNGAHWVDESNHCWDTAVRLSLPDKDVFAINAMANPPTVLPGASGSFSGVGTILYNMAVNPVSGKVYVANTEAFNLDRFEGPGIFAGSSTRGHLHESRITVLSGATVAPRHLNKHIDYSTCCAPLPNLESSKSLATPTGMAVTSNGQTLYVAALGSSKIGVFNTAELENDTFVPNTANQITVSGGGPTGLALDEAHHQLYALTRFDNAISVINTVTRAETAHLAMHNPEPPSITIGRRYLYDAKSSSSHGDSSCASCHVFGDDDDLAWDLGDPDSGTLNNPGPFASAFSMDPALTNFHPLKGAMATQSLRGMANHGPMHWRGDRTGGNDASSVQPDSGSFDERAAFRKFAPAFTDLLGRSEPLSEAAMDAFSDFILQVMYPPNPIRALDNSLTPDQRAGRDHFLDPTAATPAGCVGCHALNPTANAEFGVPFPGFFGSDGRYIIAEVAQPMKTPHLRNLYQKVGMFGMASVATIAPEDNGFMGDQIRGFGFTNDGSHDTIFRFMRTFGFDEGPFAATGFDDSPGGNGDAVRRQVEQYLLAFDSNLAPIVGQQTTLTARNGLLVWPRIDLLRDRAEAGECDLIAKSHDGDEEIGFFYTGGGKFTGDRANLPRIPDLALRIMAVIPKHEVTYTCVPPGSGRRLGIDRDGDGILDGD